MCVCLSITTPTTATTTTSATPPPPLLTNPPPRAQVAQTEHGIRAGGAVAISRAAEEHLALEFDLLPSVWKVKGGKSGNFTCNKTDLTKAKHSTPYTRKRAMMAAVCAYGSEPKCTPTAFTPAHYTLDALVALYNNLVCDSQSDPRAMQGRGHQRQVGRPGKGNVGHPGKNS
jgi:hypothetical protein